MSTSLSASHAATLIALLIVACLSDLEARRVPNVISAGLLCGGLFAQLTGAGALGIATGLAAALTTLVVLWLPWTRGWLGGGDVKAAIGTATWFGLEGLLPFLLIAALAGGVLSLAWMVVMPSAMRLRVWRSLKGVVILRQLPTVQIEGRAGAVPYCLAVAAGAFAVLAGVVPR